ncbi:DUF1015 domain-containing protein [Syntrophomonas wolfei]|jgi:uncharacterized protein (DUF1015 family)|uniref:DUF1015 domain-containing protein n=1 Tax=Syntrophomonas wolfei TaxID=863 RepID=UPI0023EFDA29|nr:DUF1015 domain-containing protein [Syntrophomonas wolfei]
MADIIPFRGLRYNPEKISNLASVVTPPYDIIDESAQARYYAENPANVIRLELGLIFPQDSSSNNRYTRAAQYLEKWQEDQTLLAEEKAALYLYQQEFNFRGEKVVRTGFVCGLKLEPYEKGNILPHEETLSKPKADRLQLMRATNSNFSSIFGLYSDEQKEAEQLLLAEVKEQAPDINIIDEAGETHKIWVIKNEELIERIVALLADRPVYIADGHHRYETALEYYHEMKEQGLQGYDYVMATLVNVFDEGLVVLPTHRLVGNIPGFKLDAFMNRLADLFEIELYKDKNIGAFMQELESRGKKHRVFGMYSGKDIFFLELKNPEQASKLLPDNKSAAWEKLDVALLDNIILDQLLGINDQKRRSQENLAYTRSEEWLMEQIDNRNYQLGFLLNPTRVEEIIAVAQARDKMPQKSTYFYPKLITGLIINKMR